MRYLGLVVGLAAALPACTEIPDFMRGDDAAPMVIMAGQWAQGSPGTQATPAEGGGGDGRGGGAGAVGAESSMPAARPVVSPAAVAPMATSYSERGLPAAVPVSPSRPRASVPTPY